MPLRLPAIRLRLFTLCSCTSRTFSRATIALVLLLIAAPAAKAGDDRATPSATSPQSTPPAALIDPKTAMDFNQRGTIKAQNGDLDGAIADFNQAIQLKRNYVVAYYNRGTAYASMGNVRAALADYTQVILFKPNNAAVRYSRGSIRASVGDRQGAIADFQQAADLYRQEGNTIFYQKAQDHIKQLQQS